LNPRLEVVKKDIGNDERAIVVCFIGEVGEEDVESKSDFGFEK
jgi:hypothetical protein